MSTNFNIIPVIIISIIST